MEKWVAKVDVPSDAIDDQTAIKVVDGKVEVISEGDGNPVSSEWIPTMDLDDDLST